MAGSSKLRPQLERFFQFLSSKRAGDIVSQDEILKFTGWAESSFRTSRNKHKTDPFLASHTKNTFRIMRDGSTLSKGEIATAFTQVSQGVLSLTKGQVLVGTKGKYELEVRLGKGAAAQVWRAKSDSNQIVAAKVMSPSGDLLEPKNFEDLKRRFARESGNGIKLSHHHVVRYIDTGVYKGHPFVILELADESLESIMSAKKIGLEHTVAIVRDCLMGLQYLHENGCTHRDIKPANILRFGDKYIVGDLGIVKWSDMNPVFTSAGTITENSIKLGSWNYMSPEQRRSSVSVDPPSDIYALGVTWYEMLAKRIVDPAEAAAKQYPVPSNDPVVNDAIARMLSYMPEERPTANELLSMLSGRTNNSFLEPIQLI